MHYLETITKTVLENGLQIRFIQQRHSRTFSIGLYIDHGAKNETKKNTGYAHLIEHLVFNIDYMPPKAKSVLEHLMNQGASYEAFTSKEYTRFLLTVSPDDVNAALEALSLIVSMPSFPKEVVEKEKQIVMHEYDMKFNSTAIINEVAEHALWGNGPYGLFILGNKRNIYEAVPEKMLEDYLENYVPYRAYLVAIGSIEPEQFVDAAAMHFQSWQSSSVKYPNLHMIVEPSVLAVGGGGKRCDLLVGFPAFSYNAPMRYSAEVLASVLGGGPGSRLFKRLRDQKTLAYSVYCYAASNQHSGYIGVHVNGEREKLPDIFNEIREEITNVIENGLTEREIETARRSRKTQILNHLENTAKRLSVVGRRAVMGGDYFVDTENSLLAAVTLENVIETARAVFDFNNVALAALNADEEDLLRLI